MHESFSDVVGLGQTTGAQYRITGSANLTTNSDDPAPVEVTQIAKFNIIGQGAVPNEKSRMVFHMTVNANGDLTASVNSISVTCK